MKNKTIFVCSHCNSRNYWYRSSIKSPSLTKYCSSCRRNTVHNGNR